jgi:hypothetical protein
MPPTKQELRDGFVEDIQRIYNLYKSLSKLATGSESLVLAEQTVVSFTVALESFISEVLVASISENSDLFLTNITQDMKTALNKAGFSHPRIQYLSHEGAKKIKADDLREIILNDGDNLAFSETRQLREFIGKSLPKATSFDVSPEDEIFIDLLKSTRNLCAHHSQKAAKTLSGMHKNHFHNKKINELSVCQSLVQEDDITVKSLGDYLKTHGRLEYICSYLRDMVFRCIR